MQDTNNSPANIPARVVLFTKNDCHLCPPARELVAAVCRDTGENWQEVNLDEQPEPTRSDLYTAHGEFLPVVEVDGVRRGYWRIEEFRLRKALG